MFEVDKLRWKEICNGLFIISSTYKMISGHAKMEEDFSIWKIIWEWKGLERIRMFLWKVAYEGLLTNIVR